MQRTERQRRRSESRCSRSLRHQREISEDQRRRGSDSKWDHAVRCSRSPRRQNGNTPSKWDTSRCSRSPRHQRASSENPGRERGGSSPRCPRQTWCSSIGVAAMKANAFDSAIIKCTPCKTHGCKYRCVADSEFCCQACSGDVVTPGGSIPTAKGVVPDQDKFHARRLPTNALPHGDAGQHHDAACAMLDIEVLKNSWWEEFRVDSLSEVDAACLVIPPTNEPSHGPAPVILFLSGHGHVDNRQDFLWGGVDLLTRNPHIREKFVLVALKPTSTCGLLRFNEDWKWTWAEDAVWAFFTEVLRRLGPTRVDPARIYATGSSLGATGVWNLATRYGDQLAAIAPMSGACEWPFASWPDGGSGPSESVLARLKGLAIRAYQIDVDKHCANCKIDLETICEDLQCVKRDVILPGMDKGKTCKVHVQSWLRKGGEADWELWLTEGPLEDWSAWDQWGGDKHFMWQRVYPIPEWGLADFFLHQSVPEQRRWRFDSPPIAVNSHNKILDCLKMAANKAVADNLFAEPKPWKELVQELVDQFFDNVWSVFGDRPWFEKYDFASTMTYGINNFAMHLSAYTTLPDFQGVVHKATHFCLDTSRYYAKSSMIFCKCVERQDHRYTVKNAVNKAREEAAEDMFMMSAVEFIGIWIATTKNKLDSSNSGHFLPRLSALKLFRKMVTHGGGIPVPLLKDMEGVTVDNWEPLNRAVNRLFDDLDPPSEEKKWKDWGKHGSEKVSPGACGQDNGWAMKIASPWAGAQGGWHDWQISG